MSQWLHWGSVGCLTLLAACGTEGPPEVQAPPTLAPIVQQRLADLAAAPTAAPAPTPETLELTEGLLQTRVHGGQFKDMAFDDLSAMGKDAILPLAQWARDTSVDVALRQAAVELLGVLAQEPDGAGASERLLGLATDARESWLRAHAAWRLGGSHSDHVVPRLVLRLKYEGDPEAFLWVASSLARNGCLAGLSGLIDLASRGDERGARAQGEIAWIEKELGDTSAKLLRRWNTSEASALPLAPPSDAQLFEVWSLVKDLSGDTFALRPVDDARYILSQLAPWCAREVALALLDQDAYVRLHVAQVLERMGGRARETEGDLIRVLAEPGVAPAAAEALGSVGSPACLEPLLAATQESQPHELRVAAVRGLGDLGLTEALAPIQSMFTELGAPGPTPLHDLRMACANALVQLNAGDDAITWLLGRLQQGSSSSDAEPLVEQWLMGGARDSRLGFPAALKEWQAFADPPGSIPGADRARRRRDSRAEKLLGRIDALLGT